VEEKVGEKFRKALVASVSDDPGTMIEAATAAEVLGALTTGMMVSRWVSDMALV
jgi:hypothetical protein